MALDQADVTPRDSAPPSVDRTKEETQKDLSQSLWDDLKSVVSKGLATEGKGLALQVASSLDFGTTTDLYKSNVLDFNPSVTARQNDLPLGEIQPQPQTPGVPLGEIQPQAPGDAQPAAPPTDSGKVEFPSLGQMWDSLNSVKWSDLTARMANVDQIDPSTYRNDGMLRLPNDASSRKNPGEIIKVDCEPETHTVKKGETLTEIARQHLGKDASDADVHKHALEIARFSGIDNPNLIKPGDQLVIPGHTANGGLILIENGSQRTTFYPNGEQQVDFKDGTGYRTQIGPDGKVTEHHYGPEPENMYSLTPQADGSYKGTDMAGNTHTKWDDGKERVDYKDGRGFLRTPDGAGGYTERHWGPRPEDKFELTKTPDGKFETREKPGDRPAEHSQNADVQREREKLNEQAEKNITDPERLAKFKADMDRLEERSKSMKDIYEKQGMTPEQAKAKADKEIAETYHQVGRLFEAQDNPNSPLDHVQRVHLAEQVMDHAATPTSLDQGLHPTCNVNTVETRTYTQNPSAAAKLVADVATEGKYETKDGKTITIDKGSLEPHDQAKNHPAKDGQRDHASQIFQVTAVNIYYQRHGDIRYEQHEPDPTLTPPDNGERRYDYSKNPPELYKAPGNKYSDHFSPGLDDEHIVEVGNQIADQGDGKDWYIRHGDGKNTEVGEIQTPEQLEEKIKHAKENGQLPIVVKVHSANEPFNTDSGNGKAGGSGGWHVVTITDYQPGDPPKVTIDNQWGSGADHTKGQEVPVRDLFRTMRDPGNDDQIADLRKEVEEKRAAGQPDRYKELDLLRLENKDKQISDEDYAKKVKEKMVEINVLPDSPEKSRLKNKVLDMVHCMPADERMKLLHEQKTIGFYSESYYKEVLAWEMADIKKEQKTQVDEGKYDDAAKQRFEKAVEEFKKINNEFPTDADREAVKQKVENYMK